MNLFRALFVWWNDATLGTLFETWLNGVLVGTDTAGNRYYRSKKTDRRWVVYRGSIDASRVPAEWHEWLHHLTDVVADAHAPSAPIHRPNLSGTAGAFRPIGSLAGGQSVRGDYEPWRP